MDTTTNLSESPTNIILETPDVIPPAVLRIGFVTEKVQTSGIPMNISDMDTNIIMDAGVMNSEAH